MSQLDSASLSELRAIAHALCEDKVNAWELNHRFCLLPGNASDPDTRHATKLVDEATTQELLPALKHLYTHNYSAKCKKCVDNYIQVLRYAKPAPEAPDPIRNATPEHFSIVMRTLCGADDIFNRVVTYLRMLRSSSPFGGESPKWLVDTATDTQLHAIGLALCDEDEGIKKRALECLRVISIFGQLQGAETKDAL
ncbi:hypothetical protein DHEL01_v209959 [Diaporthe helianthi]|uniref:Uncharacterized protein n=1 Tax=Diaporthe helianthi TaxID=158607 RepID=A0A2P5HN04_DIAHE|nr:hypothetical protein DHEL01_v209959 [Diaporthe helianthi]